MKNIIQKIIKVFLAILFLTTSFLMQVEAQEYDWQKSNSLSEGKSVVAVSEDGSKIATAGFDSYIVISSDGGQTWVTATSSGSSFWADISISSDGTKLVATNNNKIYTSTNGGITWLERAPKTGYEYWKQVYYVPDGSKIIAVHYDNEFLYTSVDDGETWQTVNFLGSKNWNYVSSSQDGSRIVVIGYNDYIYTSSDFGATWNKQEGLGVKGWKFVNTSSDSFKILAVAEEGYFYVSTNFGETWQEMGPYNTSGDFQLRYSKDGSRLFGFQGGLKVSLDDGLTWFLQPGTATSYGVYWKTVIPYQNTSKALALKNDGYLYFGEAAPMRVSKENDYVIGKGKVLFSGEANSPYKKKGVEYCLTTSSLEECVYDQTFVEEGDFSFGSFSLTVSDLLPKEYYRYRLFVEDSEGNKAYSENLFTYVDYKVWAAKTGAGERVWKSIDVSDDGQTLVAIEEFGENVYISLDGGNSWEIKKLSNQQWWDTAISSDGKYILVSGRNFIGKSSDFGKTWNFLETPQEITFWYNVDISDDGNIIGAVAHNSDSYVRVYVSMNAGQDWTQVTDVINPKNIRISSTGKDMYVVGTYSFFRSSDFGESWTSVMSSSSYWKDLAVSNDGQKIMIGGTNLVPIVHTVDGGNSWQESDSNYQVQGLAASNSGEKVIFLTNGEIKKSTNAGQSWKNLMGPSITRFPVVVASDGEGENVFVGFRQGYIYSYGELGIPKIDLGSNIVNSSSSVSFSAFVNTDHTRRGVEYCVTDMPDTSCEYDNLLEETGNFSLGDFSITTTNLESNKFYHYRFFAENEKGLTYTEDYKLSLKYNDWQKTNSLSTEWSILKTTKSGEKIIAMTTQGDMYISVNSGESWEQVLLPASGYPIISDDGEVLLVANTNDENSAYSLDGGQNWEIFSYPFINNYSYKTAYTLSLDGKYLYMIDGEYFYKVKTNTLSNEEPEFITFLNKDFRFAKIRSLFVTNGGKKLIAMGEEVMFVSIDDGKTWTYRVLPELSAVSDISISRDGKTIVIAQPLPIEGIPARYAVVSRDEGQTWEELTSLGADYWYNVAVSDDGYKILMTSWNGDLYSSLDKGKTWNREANVPVGYRQVVALSGSGENMFTAGGSNHEDSSVNSIYFLHNKLPQAKNVRAEIVQ